MTTGILARLQQPRLVELGLGAGLMAPAYSGLSIANLPAGDVDASGGRWVEGPGRAFFDAVAAALGSLPFVAEDLGEITPDVVALRKGLGLPGMAILQFAFDPAHRSLFLPYRLERDLAVYTGTHDNDTPEQIRVTSCAQYCVARQQEGVQIRTVVAAFQGVHQRASLQGHTAGVGFHFGQRVHPLVLDG